MKIINKNSFKTIAARVYATALLPGFLSPEKNTILTINEIINAPERKIEISRNETLKFVRLIRP